MSDMLDRIAVTLLKVAVSAGLVVAFFVGVVTIATLVRLSR